MRAKKIIHDVPGYKYIVIQSSGLYQIDSIDLCTNIDEVSSVLIETIQDEIDYILNNTYDSPEQYKQNDPDGYDELIYYYDGMDLLDIEDLVDIWNRYLPEHRAFKVLDAETLETVAERVGY